MRKRRGGEEPGKEKEETKQLGYENYSRVAIGDVLPFFFTKGANKHTMDIQSTCQTSVYTMSQ